jgi:hypothetical protein
MLKQALPFTPYPYICKQVVLTECEREPKSWQGMVGVSQGLHAETYAHALTTSPPLLFGIHTA